MHSDAANRVELSHCRPMRTKVTLRGERWVNQLNHGHPITVYMVTMYVRDDVSNHHFKHIHFY